MRFVSLTFALFLALAPVTAFAQSADADAHAADVVAAPDAGTPDASVDAGTDATTTAAPTPPAPPENIEDAAESLDFLVAAAKGGHWSLFFGVLLTLLVWLLDKFVKIKDKVGKAAMPWVATGLGVLGTLGIALSSGLPVGEALLQGFLTGASAVGLWELLFKHLMKKGSDPTEAIS
jgi:hypothetical protein